MKDPFQRNYWSGNILHLRLRWMWYDGYFLSCNLRQINMHFLLNKIFIVKCIYCFWNLIGHFISAFIYVFDILCFFVIVDRISHYLLKNMAGYYLNENHIKWSRLGIFQTLLFWLLLLKNKNVFFFLKLIDSRGRLTDIFKYNRL